MALSRGSEAIFIFCTFVLSFLGFMIISTVGTSTDIYCLKSIKDSLEDTRNYLNSSWNFNNQTEGFICAFVGVECWSGRENRVLNIRLSNMGLNGNFPRGIENCTSLTGLDLSFNELQGPIPSDIARRLPYVTSLDLSSNKFSGEIPSSIADCRYLNLLKLDHNQLIGRIPQGIGQFARIKIFSVANNLLSGQVPDFGPNSPVTEDSYANNQGLCGGPLARCSSHQRKFNWKLDYSFKSGFLIGYQVFAGSVVVVLTFWVPWVQVGKRKKKITILQMIILMTSSKQKRTEDQKETERKSAIELIYQRDTEISMLEKRVTRMSYVDLRDATDNFSENNVIGMGKMGILYKATLPNGFILAVKKLHDSQFLEEQFISELKTLGSLRHVNLVPLLGFCIESIHKLLVYKFMPNGNLYDWLHPKEGQEKVMEWAMRVKVAIGLARGLAWLHQNCHTIRIIHLDLTSKCILLDQNFEPKLSNFGEAMLKSSTNGSYVDSEFCEMAFVKEDVHGFGVVLLELITGVDFSRMTDSSNGDLNEWINNLSNVSNSYDAIDKSLVGQGFDAEIFQLLQVACNCVHPNPDQRPTMPQAYNDIKAMRERYCLVDDSEIQIQPEICPD